MGSLAELKERVCAANLELPRRGLVLYSFGNVSGIDRERGIMAIKPSGVPYDDLTPDMLVLVDLDNKVVDSKLNPSSDTRTHTELYRRFETIGGIVHTHSTYATAWAQARRPIPCYGTTHADYVNGDIFCTRSLTDDEIAGDYETETGKRIVECYEKKPYTEHPMILVAGHGPFTWGETPEKAVYNSVILEELAKMAHLSLQIENTIQPVSKELLRRHFRRKHGPDATYGQK